tara:strand:+ start:4104 stop:4691 length:588 start_codon:yes stop_codon:yes gene_type:complete
MDTGLNASQLFETPPGVRVIPAELLLEDPDATMILGPGDLEESEQLLAGFDPEATVRNTRGPVSIHSGERVVGNAGRRIGPEAIATYQPARTRPWRAIADAATGPGARFIYALLLMKVTLGVMGLALSWQDPRAVAVAGIFAFAAGLLLWVFWRSWLGGFPYVYRLLTSLGEDAENLIRWRLFRRNTVRIRSLYR